MSRILNAPLRAAAICAIWLSIMNQALAYQGFRAATDDDDQIAAELASADEPAAGLPPADDGSDFQSVLRRLEEAEAQIQHQQQQLDILGPQKAPFGKPTSAFGNFAVDNLTFTSRDGNFKMHVGGVVQLDAIGFANTPPGIGIPGGAGINEAVEFRRLRIRAEGSMYENIDWVSEVDLALALQNTDQANGAAAITGLRSFPTGVGVQGGNTINVIQPTTVFMTFKDIPILGNVRVGNQQNWISLEHIESARFLDFMERSTIMDAFNGPNGNGYAAGISAFNNTEDKRAGAQIGIYKNGLYDSGFTYSIGDAWVYGGRLIWTPYYDEESKGRYLLHTGIGSEWRTFNTGLSATTAFDNVRVRSRGLLRNAASALDPNYADTGNFYAVSQTVIDPEVAFQYGPLLMQAEYTASWFNGARAAQNLPASNLGTVFMSGGYAEALYFLTGENRDYNRQSGVFGRVVPNCNFNRAKGQWGAWQIGARYNWMDLNSGAVNGGQEQDMTLGLNWFLNPSARLQFNYVCSWVNNAAATTFPGTVGALNGARFTGEGPINSFGARMDFNF
jgi:phosphate-selective porin OprO/OprP